VACGYTATGWVQARVWVDDALAAETHGARFLGLTPRARIKAADPPMPILVEITPSLFGVHGRLQAYGLPVSTPDRAQKDGFDAAPGAWAERHVRQDNAL